MTTSPRTSRFDQVLDALGGAIVRGELPAGHADTIEGLVERTGASRSVVREATRVLGTLGMLSAGRRVGLSVRPREHWDVLDPLVIRWRLDSPDRPTQIAELRALREAVEPEAAAAAARRVRDASGRDGGMQDGSMGADLAALAQAADALGAFRGKRPAVSEADAAGSPAFLEADSALHTAVLALSANAMFVRLQAVIEESLRERALVERADLPPEQHDVDLHLAVARAIRAGDPEAASGAMREIVVRTGTTDGGGAA